MAKAHSQSAGNVHEVVLFKETNYARIAEDFGCIVMRIENPADIAPAIQSALSASRPVVIDVVTSPDCHPSDIWWPKNG